jgi:hypothetical protein
MTQPAKHQESKARETESFDFAEASDLCDFGYALVSADTSKQDAPQKE